ncbi:MAG TPA: DUF2071 domain-containing protein [Candidatus Elarobacter sp.]|jgi:hypothetical protein
MEWRVSMDWIDALFVHWPVPAASLRARVPPALEVDTFDGRAWVGIVAFRIAGARPYGAPAPLAWRTFPEINVRTYVSANGRSGVWFLSLDAASDLATLLGRGVVHLPYYRAAIAGSFEPARCAYDLRRADRRAPGARLVVEANAAPGAARTAQPGTLEHWLVERYCFFTRDPRGRTLRGDVEHPPWPLRDAAVRIEQNTLIAAAGIELPGESPIAHLSAGVATRARRLLPV